MKSIEGELRSVLRNPVSWLVIAAAALVACATPSSREPITVNPYQLSEREELAVDQVVIVSDASSSMSRSGFGEAKAITQSIVEGLPEPTPPYDAGFVSYGGSDRVVVPVAPLDRAALSAAASGLHLMGGLGSLGGTTPLHEVLDEVGEQLTGRGGQKAIVLVSDGLADKPELALTAAQALAERSDGKLCFHSVQVGDSQAGADLLSSLAGVSGCGSTRNAAEVRGAYDVVALTRAVFVAEKALPVVAAASPCESRVRMDDIRFAFDSAELTADSSAGVDRVARQLNECEQVQIVIGGHTDATGPDAYNQGLSERRAESVRRELIEAGVTESRLSTRGYGKGSPTASNDTAAGRAENRRVGFAPSR